MKRGGRGLEFALSLKHLPHPAHLFPIHTFPNRSHGFRLKRSKNEKRRKHGALNRRATTLSLPLAPCLPPVEPPLSFCRKEGGWLWAAFAPICRYNPEINKTETSHRAWNSKNREFRLPFAPFHYPPPPTTPAPYQAYR